MENGVGKTTVTCDGGIDTHGSWPGVDTHGHWPGQQGIWPGHGQQGSWPGQQGNWPGQRGDNIQLHVDWGSVLGSVSKILLGIAALGGLLGYG